MSGSAAHQGQQQQQQQQQQRLFYVPTAALGSASMAPLINPGEGSPPTWGLSQSVCGAGGHTVTVCCVGVGGEV